jgi:hypothetical protein
MVVKMNRTKAVSSGTAGSDTSNWPLAEPGWNSGCEIKQYL